MTEGGRRETVAGQIKGWERGLEELRLWLANAPESVHLEHQPRFVALYRRKELVKSRWEAICGVYRAAPEAMDRFEEAWVDMERAWRDEAQPLLAAGGRARPSGGR
jgi:hypothetical protein